MISPEILAEMEADFYTRIEPQTRAAIAEFVAETDQDTKDMARVSFLKEKLTDLTVRLWDLSDDYEDYVRRDRIVERLLTGERIQATFKEIEKGYRELWAIKRRMRGEESTRADRITDDDVRRAREYPIEQIIDFDRTGMTLCPFHNDRSPSMHRHRNRAHCFSCGRSWGPIDVLMERDGLTFPEAVKQLRSG